MNERYWGVTMPCRRVAAPPDGATVASRPHLVATRRGPIPPLGRPPAQHAPTAGAPSGPPTRAHTTGAAVSCASAERQRAINARARHGGSGVVRLRSRSRRAGSGDACACGQRRECFLQASGRAIALLVVPRGYV